MRHGFDLGYKIWVHHGELDLPPPPPIIDNTRLPQMSDMTALLNDLSYIPPHNEHNEPTQRDIGETSNEPSQDTRNEFEELYASANEELYPGCDYVTRLDFITKFTYFKVKGKLTDSIFNEIWKDSNTPGRKVPKKVLRYFLIIPRLQHLYTSSHTAKEMIWHATRKCTEPGKMQHPVDGRAWKKFDTNYPDFAKEPRNVRLGLAADGFNPFGNLSQAYSMWPVILTTYNLPPWLCMKESSFMLTLLIHGPKSPGKDIDVYLRPLIEDLKVLWDRKGVETIDVALGQKFNMRAMVLWTINYFSARSNLFGKTTYVGHGRFLKKPHKWRGSLEFNGETDNKDPPKEFDWDEILAQLANACEGHHAYRKNVLKAILNTLLMNDKSKDTAKARQDLQRYMKKLKGYVRNKVKPEGSITEGYVAKEALNFCSHYFWDVTTKFNRPDRNVDPLPQRVSFRCFDRPEIDTYRSQFKSLFPNKDMKEEFPDWFGSQTMTKTQRLAQPASYSLWLVGQHGLQSHLNDLYNATLHIDGQSTKVDAPPDIIDVVDEEDDIIDDEDALPHDLADSDDEDLINVVDDSVDKMSAYVVRSHGGNGGGEDRPPPHYVPTGCGGCFAKRGKGKRKPNLGGRAAGRLNTRDKTRNLPLKKIKDTKGPVPIRFETQFDLRQHMESPDWTEIHAGIQQHLQKAYNTNKAAFKAQHWIIDPTTRTYNVEKIRRARPQDITAKEWDKYIQFWNDPRNIARAAQNQQNRAKSTIISRQGSRSLARLRDEMEEMRRLEATGTYIDDEINRLAIGGKQRGHIPGVGWVLPARATASISTPAHESTLNSLHKKVDFMMSLFKSDSKYSDMFSQFESGGASGSDGCGGDEESADDQDDEDEDDDGDS
nr:hypothetical protein [Tanacetum cinerariifolium]